MTTIATRQFHGAKPGKTLLILGSIHGNEKCGTAGIGRLIAEIDAGVFAIESGTLVVAPICNPEAYRNNKRFHEVNLNRVIQRHTPPAKYEHFLAHQVMDLIEGADAVLDLHSYHSGTRPFLFLDHDTPENRAFASALGISHWITGWNEAYAAMTGEVQTNDGDTMRCAKDAGKLGITVECGQHDDPASIVVAYESIRRALVHFGLVSGQSATPVPTQINRLTQVVIQKKPGKFAKLWQHLDPVAANEVVAVYADGEEIRAEKPGVVILPKPSAGPGDEWFYFGTAA